MKRWQQYGVKPDTSMVVDDTEPTHILFRLLGEGETKPIETVSVQVDENMNQILGSNRGHS